MGTVVSQRRWRDQGLGAQRSRRQRPGRREEVVGQMVTQSQADAPATRADAQQLGCRWRSPRANDRVESWLSFAPVIWGPVGARREY